MTSLPDHLARAYAGRSVLVTGGASFIGSHLVEQLVLLGADVFVVDDLSSGKLEYIEHVLPSSRIIVFDLADRVRTVAELPHCEYVFHLAAVHGGRGFIDTFPERVLVNLAIDNNVYAAAAEHGARCIVHASSACVYPIGLQESTSSRHLLAEAEAGFDEPQHSFPDGAYGWAKLMGEYQLERFVHACDHLAGASARIFTAYGERENESHAAIALIAKALLQVDPYPIWGDGLQTRNFTHVADTVRGLLELGGLDVSRSRFRAVNVGSSSHHTVMDFIDTVFDVVGWRPSAVKKETWRPVGVASRASDNTLIRELTGWEPSVGLAEGIERTVEWYAAKVDRPSTEQALEELLLAR